MKTAILRYKKLFETEWVNTFLFFVVPLLLAFLFVSIPELIMGRPFAYMFPRFRFIAPSMVQFYFLLLFSTLIVRKLAVSTLLLGALSVVAGIANYFKTLYRHTPVLPRDIFMIRDALAVTASDVKIFLTGRMVFFIVLVLLLAALMWFIRIPGFIRLGRSGWMRLLKSALALLLVLCCIVCMFAFVFFNADTMARFGFISRAVIADTYYQNTFFTSFLAFIPDSFPSRPENYPYALDAITAELRGYSAAASEQRQADIVLIVVESWFRLDNFDIELSIDPFENYNRLAQEGITGFSIPPFYGGGRANIEYELLTGFTSGGYLSEQIAFNFDVYDGFPSISNYLAQNGYRTYAAHAHTDELYNRANAYPMLGFEEVYFSIDFPNATYLGDYISDAACTEFIIDTYEQAVTESDAPVMMHMLTMQNHIPYDVDKMPWRDLPEVETDLSNPAFQDLLATYAYMSAQTDQAISDLVDYFRTVDRDVVVIAVGDHQSLIAGENEIDVLRYTDFYDTYDEETDYFDLHSTPYLVWANFEQEHVDTFGNIPPNMLVVNALVELGVARPAYFDYLYQHTTTMNGVTGNYVVNLDGSISFEKTPAQLEEENYRYLLQYDILYGDRLLMDAIY